MVSTARIWSGVSRLWIYLEPQRAVLPGSTPLERARFIVWRPRHPFLGECRLGPRHFWSHRASLGYGTVPGPTLKRPCATFVRLVWRSTNTVVSSDRLSNSRGACCLTQTSSLCLFLLILEETSSFRFFSGWSLLCFFRVAIFVLIRWWRMTTWPQFHGHILPFFLLTTFLFMTRCSLNGGVYDKSGDGAFDRLVRRFLINRRTNSNFWTVLVTSLKTIQSELWSQIDLEFDGRQSHWLSFYFFHVRRFRT